MGKLGAFWDIPVMGYIETSEVFQNKKTFPTVSRVTISMDELGLALMEFLVSFQWDLIAVVYNSRYICSKYRVSQLKCRAFDI